MCVCTTGVVAIMNTPIMPIHAAQVSHLCSQTDHFFLPSDLQSVGFGILELSCITPLTATIKTSEPAMLYSITANRIICSAAKASRCLVFKCITVTNYPETITKAKPETQRSKQNM